MFWKLDEACVSVFTSEKMSVISASLTERPLTVPAQKLDSTSLQAGTVAPPNLAHLVEICDATVSLRVVPPAAHRFVLC